MTETVPAPCLDCDYRLDDGFVLDARIEASSVFIAHLNLCQVRVQNDRRFPWLVLVPTIADLRELTELSTVEYPQWWRLRDRPVLLDAMIDLHQAAARV